jgi:hypothetical protein
MGEGSPIIFGARYSVYVWIVKADQCELRPLPVVDRGVVLQVRKLDLAAARS